MEFRRRKVYLTQYLLIPLRIVVIVPIAIVFLFLANVMKALVGLSGFLLLLGLVWLVDILFWPGFSNSKIAIASIVILVIPTYAALFLGLRKITESNQPTKRQQHLVQKALDRVFDFAFEARYLQPYAELYGTGFPEPTFEAFGLEAEEYYSYNRRFSLSGFEFPLVVFSGMIAGYIASLRVTAPKQYLVGLCVSSAVGLAVVVFERAHSRQFPQHHKVKEYVRARNIYESIQADLRKEQFSRAKKVTPDTK